MLIPNIALAAVFANTSARFRENAPFGWRPTGNQGIGTIRCFYEDDRSWEAGKAGKNKKMGRIGGMIYIFELFNFNVMMSGIKGKSVE